MRGATRRDDLVARCLRLRRDALALLGHEASAADFARSVNAAGLDAWRVFLAIEACALPLSRLLGTSAAELEDEHHRLLHDACIAGVRRVMAARGQLSRLDELAAALDVAPILLKGAVPVAEGRTAFDLGDIDLILPAGDAGRFVRALASAGYRETLGPLVLGIEGGLPLDIHESLHVGVYDRLATSMENEPVPGFDRLRRLRAVPNLVHLVQHATTGHAHRRGNLRDVCFMADAMARCTADELEEARSALALAPAGREYLATWALVCAVRGGRSTGGAARRYEIVACGNYELAARAPTRLDALFPASSTTRPFYFAGIFDAARTTRLLLTQPMHPRSRWYWETLGQRSPRLAALVAYVARTPYRFVLIGRAAAGALLARWRYASTWRSRAAAMTSPRA